MTLQDSLDCPEPSFEQSPQVQVAGRVPEGTINQSTHRVTGDSTDNINGGSRLVDLGRKEKRRMKHVLYSGLVIEVESMAPCDSDFQGPTVVSPPSPKPLYDHDSQVSNDDSASTYSWEDNSIPHRQPTDCFYFEPSMDELQLSPSQYQGATITRTPSPEALHSHDSEFSSDDPAIYVYHYPSEWDINPPRQGGDYHFEQFINEAQSQAQPFHCGDPWRLQFIPTLLRFLGTRSNPWDWYENSFDFLLPHVWTTVYGEPSWSEEDGCLVRALAKESVTNWFDSFGSNALDAVENYLKCLTGGVSAFSEWSVHCTQMVQDGRLFYENPGSSSSHGIFRSVFVLTPLACHMQAIRGGMEVQGLHAHVPYNGQAFPFGAIGLAAAAAYRAMLLFGMQLVTYGKSGNLIIKTPSKGDWGLLTVDTLFSRSTARGTTGQCALAACSLVPNELSAILSMACRLGLVYDHEDIMSDHTDEVQSVTRNECQAKQA